MKGSEERAKQGGRKKQERVQERERRERERPLNDVRARVLDIRLSGQRRYSRARARSRARTSLVDGRVCVPSVCVRVPGCRVVDHSGVSSESSTGRATF